jgi:hypothetical protein
MPLLAQPTGDVDYGDKSNANNKTDPEALKRWLSDKRMITTKEIGGDLSLSGEVRVEFQDTNARKNDKKQLGQHSATGKPAQSWDVEVNLLLDYRSDYTWASIKIEFDDDMGVRSGKMDKIRLEKAYLGGRLVAGDTLTFDAEIGRRYLINVFDSKLEFGSLFDGVLFRLNKAFVSIGDFYFNTGVFLVDDKTNHYGFVGELGMLHILNCGLGAKYSVVDWRKHFPNPLKNDRYQFVEQQVTLFYQWNPSWIWKKLIKVYAAAVSNLIADDLVLADFYPPGVPIPKQSPAGIPTKNFGKQNWGWYAGVVVGQLRKQGDWSIETDFQWVQAQTVPDYDFSGIGRGNVARQGLYTTNIDGSGHYTIAENAVGPCNYYGFEVDALYAFTNNLTIEEKFVWSHTLDKQLGPNLKLSQFEVEFIYAF